MPESKTKRSVAMSQQNEVMYPTEKLLKSKQLAGYQPWILPGQSWWSRLILFPEQRSFWTNI